MLDVVRMVENDRGEGDSLLWFCCTIIDTFYRGKSFMGSKKSLQIAFASIDTTKISDYLNFKRKHIDSMHLKKNFGFSKREFLEVLTLIYNIDLGVGWKGKDLRWDQIKERLLFLCWANDMEPEHFSILK